MNPTHLLEYVIRPTLDTLDLGGHDAEQLVLGTAIVESGLQYLHQLGNGPAIGLWQMEPATHDDIYEHYLKYQAPLTGALGRLIVEHQKALAKQMAWNLYYGAAMCRIHYRRVSAPLPKTLDECAEYWKKHYNTSLDKGTVEKYVKSFNNMVK